MKNSLLKKSETHSLWILWSSISPLQSLSWCKCNKRFQKDWKLCIEHKAPFYMSHNFRVCNSISWCLLYTPKHSTLYIEPGSWTALIRHIPGLAAHMKQHLQGCSASEEPRSSQIKSTCGSILQVL